MKHIQHHAGGRKSFRRQIPNALQESIGKTQIRVSLGQPGSPGFLSKYESASAQYDREVAAARRKLAGAFDPLDAPTIAYLAEAFHQSQLVIDDYGRWDPATHRLFKDASADLPPRTAAPFNPELDKEAPPWAALIREALDIVIPSYTAFRAHGDIDNIVDHWRDGALRFAEGCGLIVNPNDHAGIASLCRAINDAGITSGKARLARLNGDDVPTPAEPEKPVKASKRQKAPAVPLMGTFESYAVAQGLSAGVRVEWRRYIAHLVAYLGNEDAACLTFEQAQDWRDHLLNTPGKRGPRKPVTVRDKYIVPLRATLAWAVEERLLSENVARDLKVRIPKTTKLRERDFTTAEASAILSATLLPASDRMAEGHRLARRWIPWLCAYSGGRVNEFSQLRAEDIRQVDGIWSINITPEAGTVKTQKAREVPIHAHLIEQGFLAAMQARGSGPLFYDPGKRRVLSPDNRHFKKVGERLATWVREDVKITDRGIKPNHAWRHVFKTTCREVGIEELVMDAIVGHAPASTGRKYGHVSLKTKAEAMARFPNFVFIAHSGQIPSSVSSRSPSSSN